MTVCTPSTVALNFALGADRARLGAGIAAKKRTPNTAAAVRLSCALPLSTFLVALTSMTPLPVQPDATVRPAAALASVWYLRSWRGHHRRSRAPVTTRPGRARRREGARLAPHERELALER